MVHEHVLAALVHGSGYEKIASPACSDRTLRRRLAEWAELGLTKASAAASVPITGILTMSWLRVSRPSEDVPAIRYRQARAASCQGKGR